MSGGDDGRPSVLIADDDEDVLGLVAFRLQRAGYDVITARDGEEALRQAREQSPALAVLDVLMPKLTGYEVTEALRGDEATAGIAVILLTARAQQSDAERGFDAGADEYITKPFTPEELHTGVEAVLGGRR